MRKLFINFLNNKRFIKNNNIHLKINEELLSIFCNKLDKINYSSDKNIFSFLNDIEVLKWVLGMDKQNDKKIRKTVKLNKERLRILNDKAETKWGVSKCTSLAKKNWTTCISENFSKELIYYLFDDETILNNKKRKISIRDDLDCKPDIEIDDYIFEIKCKKWYSVGTAGEKILGSPVKYNQISDITGKSVRIILLAGQEEEAVKKYHLFDVNEQDERNMEQLELWYNQGTQFIKVSDLVKMAIMK
jgi:hypothetical protein